MGNLFFHGLLSNQNSQLRINHIDMVQTSYLKNTKGHNHLFSECSYRYKFARKGQDDFIKWATLTWKGTTFRKFSCKLGFAAMVYCIWQEQNARIFVGKSSCPNVVSNQIERVIHDKLGLLRNVTTNEETLGSKELGS